MASRDDAGACQVQSPWQGVRRSNLVHLSIRPSSVGALASSHRRLAHNTWHCQCMVVSSWSRLKLLVFYGSRRQRACMFGHRACTTSARRAWRRLARTSESQHHPAHAASIARRSVHACVVGILARNAQEGAPPPTLIVVAASGAMRSKTLALILFAECQHHAYGLESRLVLLLRCGVVVALLVLTARQVAMVMGSPMLLWGAAAVVGSRALRRGRGGAFALMAAVGASRGKRSVVLRWASGRSPVAIACGPRLAHLVGHKLAYMKRCAARCTNTRLLRMFAECAQLVGLQSQAFRRSHWCAPSPPIAA